MASSVQEQLAEDAFKLRVLMRSGLACIAEAALCWGKPSEMRDDKAMFAPPSIMERIREFKQGSNE